MIRRDDRGSGTVLAIALMGSVVAITLAAVPLYSVLVLRQSVAGAADAAALAAADVATGLAPGFPCETAARVASANRAELSQCDVDGLVVTVVASRSILGFEVAAAATAGPPPRDSD